MNIFHLRYVRCITVAIVVYRFITYVYTNLMHILQKKQHKPTLRNGFNEYLALTLRTFLRTFLYTVVRIRYVRCITVAIVVYIFITYVYTNVMHILQKKQHTPTIRNGFNEYLALTLRTFLRTFLYTVLCIRTVAETLNLAEHFA